MISEELIFLSRELIPALLRGAAVSVRLIVPSAVLGFACGVLAGSCRVYAAPPVRWLADAYVAVFRGFPLLVQLYIWYFGMPRLGLYLTPFQAAVLGFTLCSGAYHSEYIRGALLAIKRGQILAAQAIGMSRLQTIVYIILPQAVRRALPGCGNEWIYLIKYSSLAYMVTCIELTGEGKIIASSTFKYTEVFAAVGFVYLLFVTLATWILKALEKRLTLPGFEFHRV
ncbi:MAG: amino acid ABC transporter permease [Desulfosoma sp.]